MTTRDWILTAVVFAPLLTGLAVGLPARFGTLVAERYVRALVGTALTLTWLGSVALAIWFWKSPESAFELQLFDLFRVGDVGFSISFLVDTAGVPMMLLTTTLTGIVGRFSFRYMHKERGFLRFFVLLCFFETGMLLVSLSGGLDVLVFGWEIVGLSSAMLVAFFTHRNEPRSSALYVFTTYRIFDVGLLVAGVFLHHYAHSVQFSKAFGGVKWPLAVAHLPTAGAVAVAVALTFAAIGKSAQLPASAWLPRAMEGPTPSSAIFYGALSVHAGAFLLLRAEPILEEVPLVRILIVVIGIATAVHATLVGRAQADVKTSLAYASMTQVGIIFAEIGAGFYRVALLHIVGHAIVRSWQLLRAPSFLHESHVVHDALEGDEWVRGRHAELIFPQKAQHRLYRLAVERFFLESLVRRLLVAPALHLARSLDSFEKRLALIFVGETAPESKGTPGETTGNYTEPQSAAERP
ncbi:MAG: proton-conducting membrane transporter [Polyangiaceae bacterium]|nr:proton-conducting membrane transporter [Polyangiaceae bacterium]